MSLKGRAAIVTGSTSGIGKAIAEAFAAQGCNVMLNGFGDKAAIEAQRAGMAKESGVKVEYHGADGEQHPLEGVYIHVDDGDHRVVRVGIE